MGQQNTFKLSARKRHNTLGIWVDTDPRFDPVQAFAIWSKGDKKNPQPVDFTNMPRFGFADGPKRSEWLFDGESWSWYEHETDMLEFSKVYPEYLFKLHCDGEEQNYWDKYFWNGKMQACYAQIVYPEFDESKLK